MVKEEFGEGVIFALEVVVVVVEYKEGEKEGLV